MKPSLLWLTAPALVAAQPPPMPHVEIPRLAKAPSMANDADISTWAGSLEVSDFGMIMPDDQGEVRWRTVAHLAWGPDALYVAVEAFDPEPSKVRSGLHRRDDFSGDLDFTGIDIDASGRGQSAIRLLVTPRGGQFDAIVGDTTGEDYSYECLWDATGVLTPSGYVVKLRVPYTSLRRRPGDWGIRFLRIIPRERRYGIAWPRQSRDVQCDVCQMAKASGAPVEKSGAPFMLIPFATFQRRQDRTLDPTAPTESRTRLGGDLRYAGNAVTLEATYRPDFATADADVDPLQVNSRFKVFYPERRPFFLEGMDLLGITGAQRQFFSRSIEEPLYGVKASGQSAWASWTVLHAKDEAGGDLLGLLGATGTAGGSTRDTALAARFAFDDRGSGLSVLGTEKVLQGGDALGGRSAGLYVDQYVGTAWHFAASGMSASTELDPAAGSLRGSATSFRVDWNTRHAWASYSDQATSPDLVLTSGFTDLTGYRRRSLGAGWQANWNQGALSMANASLRVRDLRWWNGDPLERALAFSGYLETAGRWGFSIDADLAGRAWADGTGQSVAIRSLNAAVSWRRNSWCQVLARVVGGRTLDLDSGDPARFRILALNGHGSVQALTYSLSAQQYILDHEADGSRIVRAREMDATATWQFPAHIYLKAQGFAVVYDGQWPDKRDRYLKTFLGWQPNAFTQAYVGWSGRRTVDPLMGITPERMVERGLFAKIAYAIQF